MDDSTMVAIGSTIKSAQDFGFRATGKTSVGREIGGMWFAEASTTLHETCRATFDERTPPLLVTDVVDILRDCLPIAAEASQSPSHRFANQPFLPSEKRPLNWIFRVLMDGQAHVSHSRIEVSHHDKESFRDITEDLGDANLSAADRKVMRTLGERRGRVGEPLETLWQVARHTGFAQDAEEHHRRYSSGIIPKLKIDNHLFQIERAPLFRQIKQAMDADCSGLVWMEERYTNDTTLSIELEALTFDFPEKVSALIEAEEDEAMKNFLKAREEAFSRLFSFLR